MLPPPIIDLPAPLILAVIVRFPEIEILTTISAQKVIPKLDCIFPRHGMPCHVTSEIGLSFCPLLCFERLVLFLTTTVVVLSR